MANHCFKYDPEMKHETSSGLHHTSALPRSGSQALSKAILIFLLDQKVIVHVVCLEQGPTRCSGSVLICPCIQLLWGILGFKCSSVYLLSLPYGMLNNITLELKIVERIKSDYIDINIIHLNIKQE